MEENGEGYQISKDSSFNEEVFSVTFGFSDCSLSFAQFTSRFGARKVTEKGKK